MLCIFDLDGTLANIDHRAHFVRDGARQWNEFFEACDKDEPFEDVIALFKTLAGAGHDVRIWSGRSASVRAKTEAWLDEHLFAGASKHLQHMRPEKDYRSDVVLKREWLHAEPVKPAMIFDDRQQVVDMWREEGVTCAQVAPWHETLPSKIKRPVKLTLMVGPSGSGKTSAMTHILGNSMYVGSDDIRQRQFTDENGVFDADTAYSTGIYETAKAVRSITKALLEAGLDVTVDATHIKRADRIALLEETGAMDNRLVEVTYIIVDRPLEAKLASYNGSWHTSPEIITRQHEKWQASRAHALRGDDLPFVKVIKI